MQTYDCHWKQPDLRQGLNLLRPRSLGWMGGASRCRDDLARVVSPFLTFRSVQFILNGRATRPWCVSFPAVRPDLAKFQHLGKLLRVYFVFGKILSLLWHFFKK